jgi:hypothetical protein
MRLCGMRESVAAASVWCLLSAFCNAAGGDSICGANALRDACLLLGMDVGDRALEADFDNGDRGVTLTGLSRVAKSLGCRTRAVRLSGEQLLRIQPPAIAFVNGNHYVAVGAVDPQEKRILVIDRPTAPYWTTIEKFRERWNGEMLLLSAPSRPQGPKLWVPSYNVDVGTFWGYSDEVRSFLLINVGTMPIVIRKVRFSCGCARAQQERLIIPPHSVATMNVTVNTTEKGVGPFVLNMAFFTNDPMLPVAAITMAGNVKKGLVVSPSYISVGDLPPGEGKRDVCFSIECSTGKNLVLQPELLGPGVEWRSAARQEDGKYLVPLILDVSKVECDKDGRFRTGAVIATGMEQYPHAQVNIAGRKLAPLSIMPEAICLVNVSPGERIVRSLKVVNCDGDGLTALATKSANVIVDVKKDVVHVTIIAPQSAGIFEERICLQAGGTMVEVPVMGSVRLP